MYPLRFKPIFQRYLWGGFRLRDVLGKDTGDQAAAESWELVDHKDAQSEVLYGSLAGQSLRQIIASDPEGILGKKLAAQLAAESIPQPLRNRFPLLLKFLDASRDLSIQVHPDDAMGATLSPPDLGKTEAWYVMDAQPGAKIYAGLKEGVDEAAFRAAADAGKTPEMMHSFEPKSGDCVFIKAGTLHAIGAGLLIAEIQQASNTTFRIDDWGRVDADGNPRQLHLSQGIAATDFSRGPVSACAGEKGDDFETLIACDKFTFRRYSLGDKVTVGGDGKFRIIAVTSGSLMVQNDPSESPLAKAQTALLPASLAATALTAQGGETEFLEILVD